MLIVIMLGSGMLAGCASAADDSPPDGVQQTDPTRSGLPDTGADELQDDSNIDGDGSTDSQNVVE
jgi:hypothetical protein